MILLSFGFQRRRNRVSYELGSRAILLFFGTTHLSYPTKDKSAEVENHHKEKSIPGARQRLQDRPRSGGKNRPFEELNEWVAVEISP
jgi:hypothetical protein